MLDKQMRIAVRSEGGKSVNHALWSVELIAVGRKFVGQETFQK